MATRSLLGLAALASAVSLAAGTAAAQGIPALTAEGLPNVQATHAVVMDMATGAEIYGKNADQVAGIASTTKIFVAMVVRRRGIELEQTTEITPLDAQFARGGARTRLEVRHSFKNIDLLRAMLVASDNRAPTALGRAVGLSAEELVAAMNDLARELGLASTLFTDPSGLRGNVSTARDMALGMHAALQDPVLVEIMATRETSVRSVHSRPVSIFYRNTNDALHSPRYRVTSGKTGFTRMAGYCLVISAEVAGRDVIMVFLGTQQKNTRYGDFMRVVEWMQQGKVPPLETLPVIRGTGPIIRAAASGVGVL